MLLNQHFEWTINFESTNKCRANADALSKSKLGSWQCFPSDDLSLSQNNTGKERLEKERRSAKGVKFIQGSSGQTLQCSFWWLHVSRHCNSGILYKAVIFKSCCKLTTFMQISLNKYYCWRWHGHLFAIVKAKNPENTTSSTFNFHLEYLCQNSPWLQKWWEAALHPCPLGNKAISAAYKVYRPLKAAPPLNDLQKGDVLWTNSSAQFPILDDESICNFLDRTIIWLLVYIS